MGSLGSASRTPALFAAAVLLSINLTLAAAQFSRPVNRWATLVGSGTNISGNGLAVAADGSYYVAGSFRGKALFGDLTVTSAGSNDVFLARYNGIGVLTWIRQGGWISNEQCWGIATDVGGNAIIVGTFSETAFWGTTVLASTGESDAFIAKYDTRGELLWAKGAGTLGTNGAYCVAVDGSGNSYIGGWFARAAAIQKFAPDGKPLWVKQATGSSAVYGIAVDKAGFIYATGGFSGRFMFGGSVLNSGPDDSHFFVSRMDQAGDFAWVHGPEQSETSAGEGIAVDNASNCYVATTIIQAGPVGLVASLTKYNPNGESAWTVPLIGPMQDSMRAVAVDGGGFCYITGGVDPGAQIQNIRVSLERPSGFVSKVSPSGNVLWVQTDGGGSAIAVDQSGSAYVMGSSLNKAQFGSVPLTNLTPSMPGLFVARIDQPGLQISRAADRVVVSWPAMPGGSQLEGGQFPSGSWAAIPTPPTAVEDQFLHLDEIRATNQFYRLRP